MKTPRLLFLAFSLLISATGAHAYTTSCGNDGNNDDDCPPKGVGSNPINPQRGSLLREVTDLQTFGAAPIEFTRIYNSRTREYTKPRWELGTTYTWQHNWQYELRESTATDYGFPRLIVRYPQGREYYFRAVDATGAVRVSDASWGDRLYPTGTDTYTLRAPSGREYDFRKVGTGSNYQYLLDQVRNGLGWRWTLTYQTQADGKQRLYRITNNYGRYLQLNRVAGANGYYQLTSVAANDGRSVSFGYSIWASTSETVLTSVTYPDATAAAYTWCGSSSATSGPPVLASADDPMQSTSGSRMKYSYNYTAAYYVLPYGIVNGTILDERSLVTNKVIVSLPLGSGEYPQVLEGNGTELLRKYEFGVAKQFADGEGRTTTLTRDTGGAGYITSSLASDGGQTIYTRDFAGRVLTQTNPLLGIRTFTYNANGFLLTEKDELNRTTTHTRDASNRITRTDHPDLSYETFTYTGTGLLKTHRLRNGFTETRNYDTAGNLSSLVDAAGHTWTYTSTGSGLRASVKDPRNFTTSYLYTWRGLLTKETHPDSNFREYGYSPYGKRTSVKNELGHTWTSTYTEYNQLATATDPLVRTTTYEYGREPGCGTCGYLPTLSKITLPSGKITENHYDLSGKLLSRVVGAGTPDAATTSYTYGTNGLPATMTDPRGKTTHYTYDLLHRLETTTDPLTHPTEWEYDAVGNVLKTTRANASFITNTYDAMDRLLTTTNPKSETTTYTYHPDGSMASLKDARNSSYTFLVDALSRRTRMTYPGGSYENWTYDEAGNMIQYRNRSGDLMNCTFDNRNRDLGCTWTATTPPPAVTRTYDAAGRLLTANNSNVSLSYTYDAANQLLSETYAFGGTNGTKTLGYTYDADGNRETFTNSDSTVTTTTYTARNQVASITAGGPPPVATFGYDAADNRTSKAIENGTNTAYTYDDDGQLTALSHKKGTTNIFSTTYGYNTLGLRTTGDGDTYAYDAADQATYHYYAYWGVAEQISYDPAGNRIYQYYVGTDWTNDYTTDALNQYTEAVNTGPFTYDTRGNLANYNGGTYTHDANNRLILYTEGSNSISQARDARNRVVSRTTNGVTTRLIYDDWNLVAEYSPGAATPSTTYIHGPKTDELLAKVTATGAVYYHENAIGSVMALSDASGTMIERYDYSFYGYTRFFAPNGWPLNASAYGNRFLFTGRESLTSVLYDYRNRSYDARLGRFIETDPIRFNAGDVNLYRYVSNNPINLTDPLGLRGNPGIKCPCGQHKELYWDADKAGSAAGDMTGGFLGGAGLFGLGFTRANPAVTAWGAISLYVGALAGWTYRCVPD